MLINYVPGEECRIGIVVDDRLEEFYHERPSAESHVGSIYKGVVTNVERSIQAAFVDFGLERNGFLHISDLHPMYFPGPDREEFEQVGSKTPRRDRPPIEKCLKRGQQVLVQVLKEGISTKGPTLTSYLSIPGRFIVMMPYMQRLGVTRKIEDEEVRREMRDLLKELDPPKEFGFIVRTAGIGQTKTDLKRDLAYLQRLWKNIEARRKQIKKTGELYSESDLIIRTIRDVFTSDIDQIVVDNLDAARRVRNFLAIASPRTKSKVVYYEDPIPLFTRFGIEMQLESINQRQVPLPSGGSLVIDQAEALVAIDVNSGKSRDARNAEENAYQTNLEAVDEIARQLKLRDLGGVVINDLIDMRSLKHRKTIEQRFRDNLKKDRARTRVGSISSFGILEMTRQRMRPSLKSALYVPCPSCQGQGVARSAESVLLMVMRRLAVTMHRTDVVRIELVVSPDVAFHLLNRKRLELADLERQHEKRVLVRVGGQSIDHLVIHAFDERGIELDSSPEANRARIGATGERTFRELDDPSLPPELDPPVQPDLDWEDEADDETPEASASLSNDSSASATDATADADDDSADEKALDTPEAAENSAAAESGAEGRNGRKRRRRGGRNRRRKQGEAGGDGSHDAASSAEVPVDGAHQEETLTSDSLPTDRAANLDAPINEAESDEASDEQSPIDGPETANAEEGAPRKKRRRRRRRRGRRSDENVESAHDALDEAAADTDAEESSETDRQDAEPGQDGVASSLRDAQEPNRPSLAAIAAPSSIILAMTDPVTETQVSNEPVAHDTQEPLGSGAATTVAASGATPLTPAADPVPQSPQAFAAVTEEAPSADNEPAAASLPLTEPAVGTAAQNLSATEAPALVPAVASNESTPPLAPVVDEVPPTAAAPVTEPAVAPTPEPAADVAADAPQEAPKPRVRKKRASRKKVTPRATAAQSPETAEAAPPEDPAPAGGAQA